MNFLKKISLVCFLTINCQLVFAQYNNTGGDKAGEIYYLYKILYSNRYVKNYGKVIETIDKILTYDTTHADEYIQLKGSYYHLNKENSQALKTFETGIQKYPYFPYNYSGIGFVLLDQKDKNCLSYFLKAKEKLSIFTVPVQTEQQKFTSIFPYDSINVYYGLASAYFFIEKYDSAYFYFKKSFQTAKMAECKFLLNDFNKADKLAIQALQLDRNNTLALYIRTEILWYLGKKEKCIKLLDDIIFNTETYYKPYKSIMPAKSDTIYDQYNKRLLKYKSSLYSSRAYYKCLLNEFSDAKTDIENALSYDSVTIATFNSKAVYHMMLNDTVKMFESINHALALDSNKNIESIASIYFNRAYFNYKVKKYQNALQDCNKALSIDSSGMNRYTRFTLQALIYHALNDNAHASYYANRGIESGTKNAWAYYARALIRLDNSEREAGISDLILADKYNYSGQSSEEINALKTKYNISLPKK